MKKNILSLIVFCASFCSLSVAAQKLNVLLVLADDQGYGELSSTGNPYISTPSLDKFSQESYRFSDYHSCTTCAPTRAGLMTGMHSNKVGVWHTIMGRSLLDKKQETVAEVFAKNGYATALFGKWHLGDNYPYRPFDRGFQEALWFKGGAIGQVPDFWGNNSFNSTYYNKNKAEKLNGYSTDVFTDKAIDFMQRKQSEGKAFFCYLAFNAPHAPYYVENKYAQRFLANKKVPNASYYAVIEKLDENFKKIYDFLNESGLAKNTIVIYTSDNGSAYGARIDKRTNTVIGYNASMRDKKGSVYEGGHRVPFFLRVPNSVGGEVSQLAGYIDVVPTLYELCEIENSKKLDGISLKSVLDTGINIDRFLVLDTQRDELLSKTKPSVVMYNSLRLVNRKELYDISSDIYQQNDIAEINIEIVEDMLKVHDEYWDYIKGENDVIQSIPLISKTEDFVDLNSHDRHISSFWDQVLHIRLNRKTSPEAYWYVSVPEDGVYSFELRRWAPDSLLNIKDSAPAIPAVEGTTATAQAMGYAYKDISGGEIIIGDIKLEKLINAEDNPQALKFENVELKKGEYKLYANFFLNKEKMGVHYLRVNK